MKSGARDAAEPISSVAISPARAPRPASSAASAVPPVKTAPATKLTTKGTACPAQHEPTHAPASHGLFLVSSAWLMSCVDVGLRTLPMVEKRPQSPWVAPQSGLLHVLACSAAR